MLGYINDCIEKLVMEKFGVALWHNIKEKAGCKVPDGGFLKLEEYPDASTIALVEATSQTLGVSREEVIHLAGRHWVPYIKPQGFDNLLSCQGSTLKDWMTNINSIHKHLQMAFPNKIMMPQFWCEDDDKAQDGSLLLHYFSKRGNMLAPLAQGIVEETAETQFDIEVHMEKLQTQGVNGAEYTTWKVSAVDPEKQWKLSQRVVGRTIRRSSRSSMKCPFTGMMAEIPGTIEVLSDHGLEVEEEDNKAVCPFSRRQTAGEDDEDGEDFVGEEEVEEMLEDLCDDKEPSQKKEESTPSSTSEEEEGGEKPEVCSMKAKDASSLSRSQQTQGDDSQDMSPASSRVPPAPHYTGLSGDITRKLFPYHVMIDDDFMITQVGEQLSNVLRRPEYDILGCHVEEVLAIEQPRGVEWDWHWLRMLEEQSFGVLSVEPGAGSRQILFTTTVLKVSEEPQQLTMLVMNPDAHNLEDLRDMDLTLSDLPVHSAWREAIFLREHLSMQMNNALGLQKSGWREKMILESLLPQHAADGLRAGTAVEPMLHKNVTFFFSDIVGFTKHCAKMNPYEIIDLLNKLYGAMDFLAERFNIFKVETIGDAYVAASGVPLADEDHAQNIANFAIAVNHCCKQIVSPATGEPIQLRIGIHTGPCASGLIGEKNQRYCVFGDSVNTTARHETSGLPGQIHTSSTTRSALHKMAKDRFKLVKRGLVEMKGKGERRTYWLEPTQLNPHVNESALQDLYEEVEDLLAHAKYKQETKRSIRKSTASLCSGKSVMSSMCRQSAVSETTGSIYSGLDMDDSGVTIGSNDGDMLSPDDPEHCPKLGSLEEEIDDTSDGNRDLDGATEHCRNPDHYRRCDSCELNESEAFYRRGEEKAEGGVPVVFSPYMDKLAKGKASQHEIDYFYFR